MNTQRIIELLYLGRVKPDGYTTGYLDDGGWCVKVSEAALREWFLDGAPRQQQVVLDLYQKLGVLRSATSEEIKSAYRRRARQWHPDVCKEPDAHERFIALQAAYAILSDPNKHARYNAGLKLEESLPQRNYDQAMMQFDGYRSPLRCGYLVVEGEYRERKFWVEKILGWEDIYNGQGLVLVTNVVSRQSHHKTILEIERKWVQP